jgi:hypothetical protein
VLDEPLKHPRRLDDEDEIGFNLVRRDREIKNPFS